ncbi:sigma-70 family RNA polymerase sigma factor [Sutcliffiella rhizosphaerae]|uniref:ECF RNA polymerase sigma factor SigW n=1 Tax=Sutcliffiella rhizosphaerae TaxID=2880967 RepID=A0ABM8YRN5_9BACI|nr:sigma-70 family RNA polymerase sigma factor [Sutcliffiella rhizosphaerae]CAG9622488.1 ECF RNA polymerase sigma factor SigW [Sutcliffiella rhizosphaerae]
MGELREEWLNKKDFVEQLFNRYATEVKRTAYLYLKDINLAEDVLQEVFIACYKKLEEFREECSYKTWLIRITVNKCRDHLRRWSFWNIFFSKDAGDKLVETKTPENQAVVSEEEKEIGMAILQLPIKLREVIILFYYQELGIKEISSILEINENTVKTRLHRARSSLKEVLRGGDFE